MPDLHVRRGERDLGSFSPKQIKKLVSLGKIRGSDLLCIDGDAEWIPVDQVPALSAPQSPPTTRRPKKRRSSDTGSSGPDGWGQLAALEARSAAAPPAVVASSAPVAAHASSQSHWRSRSGPSEFAGHEWDTARLSLNFLFATAVGRACVASLASGVVVMKHLSQLSELALGVFIPTAAGNTFQFKGNELAHIGVALTIVVSLLVVVLWLTFSRAMEVFLFVAGGLGIAVVCTAMMSGGDASTDTVLFRGIAVCAIIAVLGFGIAGCGLLWSPLSTSSKVVLCASVLVGVISSVFAFRAMTVTIDVDFSLPMPVVHFPHIPSLAIAYGLLVAVETGFSAWVMRSLGLQFGDVQEKETIDFFLFAHVLFVVLLLASVFLINRSVVTEFTGVVFGCVAATIAATDIIWHAATVLYTRNTLK